MMYIFFKFDIKTDNTLLFASNNINKNLQDGKVEFRRITGDVAVVVEKDGKKNRERMVKIRKIARRRRKSRKWP